MDVEEATRDKKRKKSGGFQTMGLSHEVLRGVLDKGYRVPTPIQRRVIPIALEGRDLVAMSRTGSGKTAAFLVPILQRLREHSTRLGARAVILSPTRELALQTLKAAKELGKHTGLILCALVGGESIEDQFGAMGGNPDIIVGTPGRVAHVIKETGVSMATVEVLVLDEADRLFEMGMAEQLREITRTLGDSRQTMFFSATLPTALVQFAESGLRSPELVRLDTETKLSPDLQNVFLSVPTADKEATLLHLVTKHFPKGQQTLVFVSTKHHAEYISSLLRTLGVQSSAIYGTMDQEARKNALSKFRSAAVGVLVVTDVAARGIDVPLLDNVINYDFPADPKLYVHRSGRVARAGRPGVAVSLVAHDDAPYMVDLLLFLGRELVCSVPGKSYDPKECTFGTVPRALLDPIAEEIAAARNADIDLAALKRCSENATKLFVKTRGLPSADSVRRAKELPVPAYHPLLSTGVSEDEEARRSFLQCLRSFRPKQTVFEANPEVKTPGLEAMEKVRAEHGPAIERRAQQKKRQRELEQETAKEETEGADEGVDGEEENVDGDDEAPKGKQRRLLFVEGQKRQASEYYLSGIPKSNAYERGLEIKKAAVDVALDLKPDEEGDLLKAKMVRKWDRKKKKFVVERGGIEGKRGIESFTNEAGARVQLSKSKLKDGDLYKKWLKKTRQPARQSDDQDDEGGAGDAGSSSTRGGKGGRGGRGGKKGPVRHGRSELQSFDQVLKKRTFGEKKEQKIHKKILGRTPASQRDAVSKSLKAHSKGASFRGGRGSRGRGRGRGRGRR